MLRNSIFDDVTTEESLGPVSKTGRKLLRTTVRPRLFVGPIGRSTPEMAFWGG